MLWLDITNFIEILSNDKDPAFWPVSHCPFYTLPNGKLSCYADQSVQTLTVMLENNGDFNADKLIQHYLNYFGNPESPYQIASFFLLTCTQYGVKSFLKSNYNIQKLLE